MADGRIVYANSVIIAADLIELFPLLSPPPAWPFISGGGGGGSGSGGTGPRGLQGPPGPISQIQNGGVDLPVESILNFLGGGVQIVDNPGAGTTDITIKDVYAATRVVSQDPANGTDLTIESAILNLPAEGGYLLVREGIYTPPAGGYILPDKPVKIHGCGRESTVIDMTGFLGSAFSSAFAQPYEFASFTILGTGVVGQTGLTFSFPGTNVTLPVLREVNITNVEKSIVSSPGSFVVLLSSDCRFLVPVGLPTGLHWTGGGSFVANQALFGDTAFGNGGGITAAGGTLFVNLRDATIGIENGMDASSFRLTMVGVNGGTLTINPAGGGQSRIIGCIFAGGTPARCIDLPVGADDNTIRGCVFDNFTSEAIRIASTGNIIVGNISCKVLELAGADGNLYSSNSLFTASTIVGEDSVVEGARRADDTGVTTDGFLTSFTQVNQKGLLGIGTIKNTDGANSLDVEETATDVFGVTSSQSNTVAPGADRPLNPEININAARPPYLSYSVAVKSTAPGSPATFELHHVGQGAV